jgi:uridine kinase
MPAWLCAAVVLQVDPAKVIILEGILVLHIPELREQCSMRIYVDTGQHSQLCACGSCALFVQQK